MKVIRYADGETASIPLGDLPFAGDYVMTESDTGRVVWDSRKDGYDPPDWYTVDWIELIRDENVREGAVYHFTVTRTDNIREE